MDKIAALIPITDLIKEPVIGIGEGSHGTREFQLFRLALIKRLHKKLPLVILVEDDYENLLWTGELKKGLTKEQFTRKAKRSNIREMYKSKEFINIIYYAYKHRIKVFGIDVHNNSLLDEEYSTNFNEIASKYKLDGKESKKKIERIIEQNKFLLRMQRQTERINSARKSSRIKYIKLRGKELRKNIEYFINRYPANQKICLEHNYHVSEYEKFPGLRIATTSVAGTVRAYDMRQPKAKWMGNFQVCKFDYTDLFPFKVKKPIVMRVTRDFEFPVNELVLPPKPLLYNSSKYDYLVIFPYTTAIKVSSKGKK